MARFSHGRKDLDGAQKVELESTGMFHRATALASGIPVNH
jgi:hypothetical protein